MTWLENATQLIKNRPLGTFNDKINTSNTGKGVMENYKQSTRDVGIAISDRKSTRFWIQTWADGRLLIKWATRYVSIHKQNSMACDYWNLEGVCNGMPLLNI